MSLPVQFAALRPTGLPSADVRRFLLEAGRADTLRHSARVAAAGARLARRFGLPAAPLRLACLAHDLAAVVALRDVIAVADALGLPLRPADRAIPQVLHGPIGAEVLRRALSVYDEQVLDAVRFHTTLRAGAGQLEQAVFVADKLAYDPTVASASYHARLAARADSASLAEMCWIYLDWAVAEGPGLGWRLHSDLLEAWEDLRPRAG